MKNNVKCLLAVGRVAALAAVAAAVAGLGSPAVAADSWGDLTIKFVFDGAAPARPPINATKDQATCGQCNLLDESLIVGDDGGVANVVVYVSTKKVKVHPDLTGVGATAVLYDNKCCRFEPHVAIVLVGQELKLHNSDNVGHNSNVSPILNPAFNQLIPTNGESVYKFGKAEKLPVKVACNVHPWMSGYLVVRDNPYAAVSAADGTLSLKNLPAGEELEFLAWHERSGYVSLTAPKWEKGKFKMKLKPGANDLGAIKLPASLFKK